MNRSFEARASKTRDTRGSLRFLALLVLAGALAAAGMWMASRNAKSSPQTTAPEPAQSATLPSTAPNPQPSPARQTDQKDSAPSSSSPVPTPILSPRAVAPVTPSGATYAKGDGFPTPEMTEARRGARQPERRVQVSGTVFETREYCGGANPSEEILEAVRRPRPLANHEMYVRAGPTNALKNQVLLKFTTDEKGNFQIALPAGEYCILEAGKKNALKIPDFTEENRKLAKTEPAAIPYSLTSPNCLTEWWQTCDKVFRVGKKNQTGMRIELSRGCHPPCVQGGPDVR